MPKHYIILNPIAGRGASFSALEQIERKLTGYGLEVEIVQTSKMGQAVELAYQASKQSVDVVIAAGGDGTSNEVINGLMRAKREGIDIPAMGVIAIGRGNDFAYSMDVPTELEENLQVLANGYRHRIDIGHVVVDNGDGRYFGNCIGVGFDAEVGFVAVKLSPLSGFLNYIIAAILTDFIYFKAPRINLYYGDEKREMHSLMVSVMNGIRLGGGFYMTPESINDDGYFDLCIVANPNRFRVLTLLPHFMKGTQISQKEVEIVQSASVNIVAIEGSLPAHVDGETLCTDGRDITVELLPQQIELICREPS